MKVFAVRIGDQKATLRVKATEKVFDHDFDDVQIPALEKVTFYPSDDGEKLRGYISVSAPSGEWSFVDFKNSTGKTLLTIAHKSTRESEIRDPTNKVRVLVVADGPGVTSQSTVAGNEATYGLMIARQ